MREEGDGYGEEGDRYREEGDRYREERIDAGRKEVDT